MASFAVREAWHRLPIRTAHEALCVQVASYYYNNCSLVCCCLAQGTGSRVDSCRVGLASFRHIVCDSPAITEHTACGSSELLVHCCARVPQSKLFFFTVSCITSISIDVKLVSWYSWICSVRLADYAPLVGKAVRCLFSYLGLWVYNCFYKTVLPYTPTAFLPRYLW